MSEVSHDQGCTRPDADRPVAYFASRGEHDKAKKTLLRVNGKVPGYDVEREYAVVINTIEEERRLRSQDDFDATSFKSMMISYTHCFKGINLVGVFARISQGCMPSR